MGQVIHRPWQGAARLRDTMCDSSLQDVGVSLRREPRSGGVHASPLLRKLYPIKENDITEPQLNLMALAGLAFEDRAEQALLSLNGAPDWMWTAERSGEVTSDEGIVCSPDILLASTVDGSVREVSLKATWKSCRHLPLTGEDENGFPDKFNYYLAQCMCYAHVLGTLSSILVVYFVAGDYTKPLIPQFHAWELEFTVQEREENWDALMTLARGGL